MTDAFPREQLGLAMGTNTMVAAVGLVLGPVLGGAPSSISGLRVAAAAGHLPRGGEPATA